MRSHTQSITPTMGFSANNNGDGDIYKGSSSGKQKIMDENLKNIKQLDYSMIDKKKSVILSQIDQSFESPFEKLNESDNSGVRKQIKQNRKTVDLNFNPYYDNNQPKSTLNAINMLTPMRKQKTTNDNLFLF